MWKKSILKYLLPFGFCLAFSVSMPDTISAAAMPDQVTLSAEQYSRLQAIINQQEQTLNELDLKLQTLSSNSAMQQQTLITLQTELSSSRTQLQQTELSLKTASSSLQTAEETLKKQEKSLQTLQQQVNDLDQEAALARRQRNVWAVGAGLAVLAYFGQR